MEKLNKLNDSYILNGYVVVEDFLGLDEIAIIQRKIQELATSKNVDIYTDRDGNARRMERFTFADSYLKMLNQRVVQTLSSITHKEHALFKDKVNFKPPMGEGFFAHYDGVFQFRSSDGQIKNGWYEYATDFDNVLIALDDFTLENGALEISTAHKYNFEKLLSNTKRDGTPDLTQEVINSCKFNPLLVKKGGLAIFKHNCPHRSGPNYSNSNRMSLYWTYTDRVDLDLYHKYFNDKHDSKNLHKALLGERFKK